MITSGHLWAIVERAKLIQSTLAAASADTTR